MMTLPFVFASLGYVVGPTLLILVVITIWGGQSILTRYYTILVLTLKWFRLLHVVHFGVVYVDMHAMCYDV